MKNIVNEFKKFALRGNVIDLAVGIIIGGAFNKIVSSVVDDIIMPPIGLILGSVDFSNLYVNLGDRQFASLSEAKAAGAPTLNYGLFLNSIIVFLITALAVFLLVRFMNKLREKEDLKPEPAPTTKPCPYCHTVIHIQAVRCPACTSDLASGPSPAGNPAK